MTQQPPDSPQVFDGTDIEVAPEDVDREQEPAAGEDKAALEEDETLGGTGGVGPGGAG